MTIDANGGKGHAPSPREAKIRPVPHRMFVRAGGAGTAPEPPPIRGPVDVICAGMYRACSTWQYEVVAHLLEHHRGGRRLGYLMPQEYIRAPSRADADGGPTRVPGEGWRVFKSHDGHRCFARAIARRRAVAIYAYRDVRDVVFSLMHKRRLAFEELLRQGMIHQVLANDQFWTRQPGVLIQRYDAILADPIGAVRELAHHLGIEPSDGEAERIADEYSLAANKARTEALRRRLEQAGTDLDEAANSLICDPATLLHWNHVRDGRSGSWFVEASPRQKVILRRMCGRWLTSRGYPLVPEGAGPDAKAVVSLPMGESVRIELEILRGWLSFRVREASQRFPRLAAIARRALGIKSPAQVGAKVWSESKRA
jgi:Sulfotransferase domain